MQNVLILGNITKDIYLRLDNRQNHFETDQNNTKWLDLAFNGSSYQYYSRVSIYGGTSISLEVLSRFGHHAAIAGTPAAFLDGQFVAKDANTSYRYILCQDENAAYIAPSSYKNTIWREPDEAPDWLYVDRSAKLTPDLAKKIEDYLNANATTKLALFVSRYSDQRAPFFRALAARASFIITDTKLLLENTKDPLVITDRAIEYRGKRIAWSLKERQDLVTRLSSHLTIAASVFAAILAGKSADDALLLARANIENSKLNTTTDLSKLEPDIANDHYRLKESSNLQDIARRLVAHGKGILAADESGGSIHKKFEAMSIPDDETHRRDYRNLFFTTPKLEEHISGVILFDETARQHADNGQNFIKFLNEKGIIAGVKVDEGLIPLDEGSNETITKGLDGLENRLKEYYGLGARFAKWRAALTINDPSTPSVLAIRKNAEILAKYAKACQNAKIVPIVEPELVFDGDYSLNQSATHTGHILDALFGALKTAEVDLSACILKCNMVIAGKRYAVQSTPEEVGRATAEVLRAHVPKELAGVVFLSGGQSVEQATANLQAVTNQGPFPWPVTFSFARALQEPALNAWRGDNSNADVARDAFRARLIANTDALKKKSP